MGINLQGGFGAGGAVDALRQLVAEAQRQQALDDQRTAREAQLAEESRQFNELQPIRLGELDVRKRGVGVDEGRLDLAKLINTQGEPQRVADTALTQARTDELARQPQAEADARAHAIARDQQNQLFNLDLSALGGRQRIEQIRESGNQARQTDAADPNRGARPMSEAAQLNALMRLQSQWDDRSKDARTIRGAASKMQRAWDAMQTNPQTSVPAVTEAVQVMFQKILDPTSVVREGEFTRSMLTQPVINRMQGALQRLATGGTGIPVEELKGYVELAKMFADSSEKDLAPVRERISRSGSAFSIPPELIFDSDIGSPAPQPNAPKIGERRSFNGQIGEWDGQGWKPVK